MTPRIYFIRHGETDWNAEGRLQGQRDIPLNDLGRVQAHEAGAKLKATVPLIEDCEFLCSPMLRTRETMEIARRAMGLHGVGYRLEDRLKELTFGEWEGSIWSEVKARDPIGAKARTRDKWNFAPPGGESYAMLAERVRPVIDGLTRDTVMVSHGGVARALMAMIGGVPIELAPNQDIWQGKTLIFADGRWNWR
ncbi:MAG: histidine phosphatase family protein [Rhizobiales bacterium 65-9]|nr:histidine phosphatase family protein [Hyphomicrobiales bacterium]OJY37312.1 MAG: histidine phosphatase family protein [Rhizobiales bacterium 65-9]